MANEKETQQEHSMDFQFPFIPWIVALDSVRPYVPPPQQAVDSDQFSPPEYLLVSNLPHWTTVEDIMELMADTKGAIQSIQFCRNHFGFFGGQVRIVFSELDDVARVMSSSKSLGGRTLSMQWVVDGILANPPTCSIVISNLPKTSLTASDLAELFKPAGDIVSATFRRTTDGRLTGQAILLFRSSDEAFQAVELFHGYEFKGRPLRVQGLGYI